MSMLSGKLVDFGHGLLDVSISSYNHLIRVDLPRMINNTSTFSLRKCLFGDMRPIVWSERGVNGQSLSVTVQMHFASVQKPMLTAL